MTKKGTTGAKRDRGAGGRGPDDEGQVDGSGEERSGAFSVSIGMGNGGLCSGSDLSIPA